MTATLSGERGLTEQGRIDCLLAGGRHLPVHWMICAADELSLLGESRPPRFLSAAEQEVFDALRFSKRRQEWLFGRWTAKQMARSALASCHSVPLTAMTIAADPDGAPYLSLDTRGRLPVSLSISHRAERAFCALALTDPGCSVGADVERIETRSPAFVTDFFTAAEAEQVNCCPMWARDRLSCAIWSAKEAVLKTLRTGLRVDTRQVEIVRLQDLACPIPETGSWRWKEVVVRTALPNAQIAGAWWAVQDGYVYTLAVNVQS